MTNPNARLLSESVRHQTQLLRFAARVGADARATLNAADDELLGWLGKVLRNLLRATPAVQQEMRGQIGVALGEINGAVYDDVQVSILGDMAHLARYEEEFQAALLTKVTGREVGAALSPADLEALLHQPILGRSIPEQLDDAAAARLLKINKAIGNGVATGARPQDVLDAIEGTADAALRDGQLQGARDWLDALAATDTAGVADSAGRAVYEASGVVKAEQWVSVLDSATTPVCRANDGAHRALGAKSWSNGYSGPYPAHYGERSVIIPLVDREPVDKVTYDEWLRGQPERVQEEALGPTRLALWREGRLPFSAMVSQAGRQLSLDELRSAEAEAFKRAGLDSAA